MNLPCSLDPALHGTLRCGLSLLLLSATAHKLRDPRAFTAAVAGYHIVPRAGSIAVSRLIIAAELLVGAALLLTRDPAPAWGAAGLLATYTLAIVINLLRGRRDIDCGCAGPIRRVPIGGPLVIRNLVLIAAALMASLPYAPRALTWLDDVTLVCALTALALMYSAVEIAMAHPIRLALQVEG